MTEYSQITFDFFTPPTASVKKSALPEQEPAPATDSNPSEDGSAGTEEIVDIVFPEQIAPTTAAMESSQEDQKTDHDEAIAVKLPAPAKSTRGRKSLKSFALSADLVNIPEDEILFQKQYYSIGEVSEMFQVNASLLRYWESEFDIIQPRKNRKGDRHFRPVDIKNLELIHDLLRRRKLTIEGAKDFLKRNSKVKERFETIQNLRKIRSFLAELKGSL